MSTGVGLHAAKRRKMRAGLLYALAFLAIVLTVGALTRAFVAEPDISAPDGLVLTPAAGAIDAQWNSVDGAEKYMLIRKDGTVAYVGAESTAKDSTPLAGKQSYRVIAIGEGGRESAASAAANVQVDDTWGDLFPFVKQFPKLLPQVPSAEGWSSVGCIPMVRPDAAELGQGDSGSGRVIGQARIGCSSSDITSLQVSWMISKEAADIFFGSVSAKPGRKAVRWQFGTGYFDALNSDLYLRLDEHDTVFIGLGVKGATQAQLLELANSLPLR